MPKPNLNPTSLHTLPLNSTRTLKSHFATLGMVLVPMRTICLDMCCGRQGPPLVTETHIIHTHIHIQKLQLVDGVICQPFQRSLLWSWPGCHTDVLYSQKENYFWVSIVTFCVCVFILKSSVGVVSTSLPRREKPACFLHVINLTSNYR